MRPNQAQERMLESRPRQAHVQGMPLSSCKALAEHIIGMSISAFPPDVMKVREPEQLHCWGQRASLRPGSRGDAVCLHGHTWLRGEPVRQSMIAIGRGHSMLLLKSLLLCSLVPASRHIYVRGSRPACMQAAFVTSPVIPVGSGHAKHHAPICTLTWTEPVS